MTETSPGELNVDVTQGTRSSLRHGQKPSFGKEHTAIFPVGCQPPSGLEGVVLAPSQIVRNGGFLFHQTWNNIHGFSIFLGIKAIESMQGCVDGQVRCVFRGERGMCGSDTEAVYVIKRDDMKSTPTSSSSSFGSNDVVATHLVLSHAEVSLGLSSYCP
eukprot:scaffold5302_cov156-Amphora_coffeaeformis.AAC.2